jgi:hypothetical protein
MASRSEVGHNKNVANFSSLTQILLEMGVLYNPSNTNIQLNNLDPIKTALAATISEFNLKKPIYTNAVATRETAIAPLSKRTTSILNSFKSLTVTPTDKENLTAMVKKVRGDRKSIKVNPDTAENKSISTAQLSYDSRIANLDTLIGFVSSHPKYNPNEEDIKVVTLKAYHQELTNLSQQVNAAGNTLITIRKDRNTVLYNGNNNVIQLASEIKSYLKSLGDNGKPYYKAAVRLIFKEIK